MIVQLLCVFAAMAFGAAFAAKVTEVGVTSRSMGKDVPVSIVLPDKYFKDPGAEWAGVYLLHGAGGSNRSDAVRDVEFLADTYDVIFVCPDGAKTSWWFDSPVDPSMRYETFVTAELVPWIDAHYRTYGTRTQRAVMGGSMGGHGACWLGFRHKDLFGAVGNIYGGVDLRDFPTQWDIAKRLGPRDEFPARWRDHSAIAEAAKLKNREIELITVVGTSDFFLPANRRMHELLSSNKVAHTYVEIRGETEAGSQHTMDVCYKARALVVPFLANYFASGKAQIAKGFYPLAKRYTVKVTKKVWKETPAPQVELPEPWKVVEGDDGYTALDVRDFYFTVEAPTQDGKAPPPPRVKLTWPGVEVSGVYGASGLERNGDTLSFVADGRAGLCYMTTFCDGPIVNGFHHHVDGTQHGPYRNKPQPWIENRASANWRAACRAMFLRAGFGAKEATDGANINLYGYDTNFPYRHVDHPTHFHIMLEWDGFSNNNVGHYTLNPDGSIRGNNFLVCGQVAGYPRTGYYPQMPGATTDYNGPKGTTVFSIEMRADGTGIILKKPGAQAQWMCRSKRADEEVSLYERTSAESEWTPVASYAVDDRPAEGVMEIVERPLPEGRESCIVVTYDRDTAALKEVRRFCRAIDTTKGIRK